MGHQYLLESNYSCLWKHVENNLFLSNFMKISSPSLNIFYHLFYFRGFFPTRSSSLEYSFFTWNLSIFRPYLAVFSHWIYTTPLWQNLLTFRSTIVFLLLFFFVLCVHIILQVCEIWFKILMCICSIRIPSLEYSLFTWNLSIFRFNLAVLLPLWQNLLTFRSMIVFLFYRCVICVKHLNLQLNRVFSFT
jgi:hypothetical protein